ncbi:hypothetical protein VAC51_00049 [Variovorax phage VAC_51]|nr:hypothetical protein VAC51_00049 [Variovorax phage VAC_51]
MAQSLQVDPRTDMYMEDKLRTSAADPRSITFTKQQLEALEKIFPEQAVASDAMSDAKVRHHLGQRSVIAFVRDRVR